MNVCEFNVHNKVDGSNSAVEMWGVRSAFNLALHLRVDTEATLGVVSSPLMFNV